VVHVPLLRSLWAAKFNFTFKALHSLSLSLLLLVGWIFKKMRLAAGGGEMLKWYYPEEVFVFCSH
jgi:hypothetical protein